MPSFVTPIHEANDCHNPKGPGGGQFCGKGLPAEVQGTLLAKGLDPERFHDHAVQMMQRLDTAHGDDPTWQANVAAVRDAMAGYPMIHTSQLGNVPTIEQVGLLPGHSRLTFDRLTGMDRTVFMRMGQAGGGGMGAVGIMIDPRQLDPDRFLVTKLGLMTLKQDEDAYLRTPGDHTALLDKQLAPFRDTSIPYADLPDVQSRLLVHGYEKDHPEARGTAIDPNRIVANDHGEMEVKYAGTIPPAALIAYFAGNKPLPAFGNQSAYDFLRGKVPTTKLVQYTGESLPELSAAYRAYYARGRGHEVR